MTATSLNFVYIPANVPVIPTAAPPNSRPGVNVPVSVIMPAALKSLNRGEEHWQNSTLLHLHKTQCLQLG